METSGRSDFRREAFHRRNGLQSPVQDGLLEVAEEVRRRYGGGSRRGQKFLGVSSSSSVIRPTVVVYLVAAFRKLRMKQSPENV